MLPAFDRRQGLTRRANHLHMFNIARILSPRRETGSGLFESNGGRNNSDPSNRIG
jgi:hypothetical protein